MLKIGLQLLFISFIIEYKFLNISIGMLIIEKVESLATTVVSEINVMSLLVQFRGKYNRLTYAIISPVYDINIKRRQALFYFCTSCVYLIGRWYHHL